MTLLDAPAFDAARDRRNTVLLGVGAGLFVVLFVGGWFLSGRPVDWPWRWWTHFRGRMTVNRFLDAVEQNNLQRAYAVWTHDPDWQTHVAQEASNPFDRFCQSHGYDSQKLQDDKNEAQKLAADYGKWLHDRDWQQHQELMAGYPFDRFSQDWSPTSSENEYGAIKSHHIVAARMSGNVLLMGIRVNGRKSDALFLDYDPKMHSLGFSPVELYLGP
jgi:hypothetical protein